MVRTTYRSVGLVYKSFKEPLVNSKTFNNVDYRCTKKKLFPKTNRNEQENCLSIFRNFFWANCVPLWAAQQNAPIQRRVRYASREYKASFNLYFINIDSRTVEVCRFCFLKCFQSERRLTRA